MKVCARCMKPVPQCVCSQEVRIAWEKEARSEKEESWKCFQKNQQWLKDNKHTMTKEEYDNEQMELEDELDMWKELPENYEDNSFEIDDDILDTILTLWDKGYHTHFCCAGHPNGYNQIYIVFQYGYYFDFSNSGFDDNWKYSGNCQLDYMPTQKALRKMEKDGIDPYTHLCEQRDLLNRWVHQLPPARKLEKGEKVKGIWMKHRRTKKELEAAKAAAAADRSF